MATIRGNCPQHGDIETTPEHMRLFMSVSTGHGWYEIPCPDGDYVNKAIEDRTIDLLVASGVKLEMIQDIGWHADKDKLPTVTPDEFEDQVANTLIELHAPTVRIDEIIDLHFSR